MKNSDLSKKIKELRTNKGFSQDELSQVSQLSLRTIQRIESGETEPRGDTLRRLAQALDVTPNELIDWTEHQDNGYLAILNLSALSFIAFPLLGVIIPLALWVLKREKIKRVDYIGKRIINFQITWCLFLFIGYISVFSGILTRMNNRRFSFIGLGAIESILLIFLGLYVFNFILVLINTIRSMKNKNVIYQPAIRFLR